jgi:hypothetical protein
MKPKADKLPLVKANSPLAEGLIAVVTFIFSVITWCLRKLLGLPPADSATKAYTEQLATETQDRKNEIALLRIRNESEIDTLREEITQMRTEISSLKSSVIALRRTL